MKADDSSMWAFEPDLSDESEVFCRECGEWSPIADWTEGEIDCETCGSHSAIMCPQCGEAYDHVWSSNEPLKTRKNEARRMPAD